MWYAIQTEPGQEESIKQLIGRRASLRDADDCRILYCVRKKRYLGAWHEEREHFLPGYLFWVTGEMRGVSNPLQNEAVFSERSVLDRVPECRGRVLTVGYEEEKFLIKLTGGKDEIGMSYGVIRNGILEIRSGVLAGMESRVRKIDRHKRKGYIGLRIHGEEKIVEMGLEITEKTYPLPSGFVSGKTLYSGKGVS